MTIIGNGRLITRTGLFYENGAVAYGGNTVTDVGETDALRRAYPEAEFIDANGGVIMPGLINTHNHIYSAFARGMSVRGYAPKDFNDILSGMWWKMDRCLTHENNRLSAEATYIDCIKSGVTTCFDHHASYFDIPGSLDDIAGAAKSLGVRTALCYEVSDRDGEKKMLEAVEENARMIRLAAGDDTDLIKGMMGLHASFTLSDGTLDLCREKTPESTGFHIHVAEGISDVHDTLRMYGKPIVNRLYDHGILGEHTLAVHCVHIGTNEMRLLRDTNTAVVHNPESNMGNAVGCGPVIRMFREGLLIGLGTDGYTNDMLESYKVANLIHKHSLADPGAAWNEIPTMLFENNAKIAARFFKKPLGVLEKGAYADIIVCDYDPLTPMDETNVNGHILFGMNGRSVVTTVCNGKTLMLNRRVLVADEGAVMAACRESAAGLWKAINA